MLWEAAPLLMLLVHIARCCGGWRVRGGGAAQGLANVEAVTLPSGLAYKDIVKGDGASPIPGFQVVVNYVSYQP